MEFEDYFKNDKLMNIVRETVKLVFSEVQERISYGMPAWFGHRFPSSQGMLLCFLGHNDLHRFCLRLGLPYTI